MGHTPAEAEERHYAMLKSQPWPHNLNQTVSGKAGAVQIARFACSCHHQALWTTRPETLPQQASRLGRSVPSLTERQVSPPPTTFCRAPLRAQLRFRARREFQQLSGGWRGHSRS